MTDITGYTLSPEALDRFVEALENPPAPTEALKKLFREYEPYLKDDMAEEIKRLRVENERLAKDWNTVREAHDNLVSELDLRLVERRALRALNAELVEGLKHVMGWIDGWSPNFTLDDEWPEYEHNIRRAIAKAEGR